MVNAPGKHSLKPLTFVFVLYWSNFDALDSCMNVSLEVLYEYGLCEHLHNQTVHVLSVFSAGCNLDVISL